MLSDEEVISSYKRAIDEVKGGITFESFLKAYCECLTKAGLPGLDHLRDAFSAFDNDKSGSLCHEEIEKVFVNCCPVALPAGTDITSIVSRIDANGDGNVSIEEFLAGLTNAWVRQAETRGGFSIVG